MLVGGVIIALTQFGAEGTAWARQEGTTTTATTTTATTLLGSPSATVPQTTLTAIRRPTAAMQRTTTTTTVPATTTTTVPATTTTTVVSAPTAGGFDISWPQCSTGFPAHPVFGIVGASGGVAFSDNPCLAAEHQWAASAPRTAALYANSGDPGSANSHWTAAGPKACSGSSNDLGCAYNYGWNAARDAFAYAATQASGTTTVPWWLDVETGNTWSSNTAANDSDLEGMVDYFGSVSVTVGVYSTSLQWGEITGGMSLNVPNWVAGASSASQAASWCAPARSFSGGPVSMVQYLAGSFNGDVSC